MPSRVVMPKLSDTMEEGRLLRWIKQEGDTIETGQALAEVETDKATVEMEAYTNGILRRIVAPAGSTVKVGDLIAVIGTADEDISALVAAATPEPAPKPAASAAPSPDHAPAAASQPAPAPVPRPAAVAAPAPSAPRLGAPPSVAPPPASVPRQAAPASVAPPPAAVAATRRTFRASPLAARMAAEAGVDLSGVAGSGPQGRIVKRDVEATLATGRPAEAADMAVPTAPALPSREGVADYEDVELSQMRRTIAKRLLQSKAPVPHFYLTVDIAMDRTWEAYRALRDEKSPITINDIVVKATAMALRRHPEINATFAGDHVRRYNRVHIGLAVALDDGLITPVVRDADLKTLEEIAAESKALADLARTRRLQPHEYTGATFSISNLGMMGVEEFSAIINPPEAAILAVGAVRQAPVVESGAVRAGYRMKVTLSVDHRVADGAMGARFLQTLRRLLENPLLMA